MRLLKQEKQEVDASRHMLVKHGQPAKRSGHRRVLLSVRARRQKAKALAPQQLLLPSLELRASLLQRALPPSELFAGGGCRRVRRRHLLRGDGCFRMQRLQLLNMMSGLS